MSEPGRLHDCPTCQHYTPPPGQHVHRILINGRAVWHCSWGTGWEVRVQPGDVVTYSYTDDHTGVPA